MCVVLVILIGVLIGLFIATVILSIFYLHQEHKHFENFMGSYAWDIYASVKEYKEINNENLELLMEALAN